MTTVSDVSIPPLDAACQPLRSHVPGSPAAESRRRWKLANPEKVRAQKERWKKRHPENMRRARAKWQKSNPEKVRQIRKRWNRNHREYVTWLSRVESSRYRAELRPIYLRHQAKKNRISPVEQKIQIQLWRSKNLLKMMATAASLNP